MSTVAIKERPILFSAPMVRAILDGRKTQTRRAWKLSRGMQWYDELGGEDKGWFCDAGGLGWWHVEEMVCPYGTPGERLWVRETFRETWDMSDRAVMEYRAGGTRLIEGKSVIHGEHRPTSILPKWRPSIFMPRWASRITLEITDVRVERLQEISEEDAQAEGVEMGYHFHGFAAERHPPTPVGFRPMFRRLWGEINGEGSWEANPWVWAITFKKL